MTFFYFYYFFCFLISRGGARAPWAPPPLDTRLLYKGDIKKTWLIINKTLSNKKTSYLSQSFSIGNKLISDPNEIVNKFNKYFINIGKQISNQIVPTQSFQSYLTSPINKRFKLMEVDDNKTMRIVNNLENKSSYGYDYISNLLLKCAKNELIKPLTLIINQTINTGIFPEQLKISKVKPLFKWEIALYFPTTAQSHCFLQFQKFWCTLFLNN